MIKATVISILFILANAVNAADTDKTQPLCINNNLTYSIGSLIKEKDGKTYRCTVVYEKNMKKTIAWVQFEVNPKDDSKMILKID